MEALVIITYLFLIGLVFWAGISWHQAADKVKRYEKKFEHQKEELKKAAFVNSRLRTELGDMRTRFIRAANLVERLEYDLETKQAAAQFSGDDLKTLINLCHPDRHGGKESAHRITQILLKMRR